MGISTKGDLYTYIHTYIHTYGLLDQVKLVYPRDQQANLIILVRFDYEISFRGVGNKRQFFTSKVRL